MDKITMVGKEDVEPYNNINRLEKGEGTLRPLLMSKENFRHLPHPISPAKIALAGTAALALSAAFVFQRTEAPLVLPTEATTKATRALALAQMPFDHPSWEPDEATKNKALMRAYHMNGGSMVSDHMIDVSQQEGIVTADAPAHVEVEVVNSQERNALDAQADKPAKGYGRRKLAHRGDAKDAKSEDTCTRHKMHKVVYRDRWRCRK